MVTAFEKGYGSQGLCPYCTGKNCPHGEIFAAMHCGPENIEFVGVVEECNCFEEK